MSEITRRQLLTFLGAGAAAAALSPSVDRLGLGIGSGQAEASGFGRFTPVRLPHPLPIYTTRRSFLPTGAGDGVVLPPAKDPSLATYTVLDDVVVPPEFERYVIVRWGDRVFPTQDDYVGYNHDYTAFFSLEGDHDGLLWVNHEYVSFPFSFLSPDTPANLAGFPTSFEKVVGFPFPATKDREALGEMLYNCGGSVLHVRKSREGRYRVRKGDEYNRRVHGLSGLAINADRADGYQLVTDWGARAHQKGDQNYLVGTGPAAKDVFPLSTDGLGEKIIGTAFNCSGASTPWGTVLSSEENFQGSSAFFLGVTEDVLPNGTQTGYLAGTTGIEFGQVGEKYGWIVEVDPKGHEQSKKHTALGRFRHENLALRAEANQPLVAYMGDDRRGGHVWKFVSKGEVKRSTSKRNSDLLERGTLFVARFNPDGAGAWIPLQLTTPTNPNVPSVVASVKIANLGPAATGDGTVRLPKRIGIAGQTTSGGSFVVNTLNEATALTEYRNKTLADFYSSQGAIHVDAFLAANLVGGTPCARPEDFEVNPDRPREIFMAMTDGAPGGDGYPDSRIFVVAKYGTGVAATQQSGSLHKIIEDTRDGTGTTFHWERFVQAGEAGAAEGTGFAAVDNLTFDRKGDLWGVTDMSTNLHNGFDVGSASAQQTISHALSDNTPNLVGVFGANWLFVVPLDGPDAGRVCPFAYGPVRCEMTGPTFVDDTLIISVQHPSEDSPIGDGTILSRSVELLKLDGSLFSQTRTVPRGSNWPDSVTGDPANVPRPCTIGIQRKQGFK
jgi:secreted PhoX family phosphatase